ncbi:SWIRM domain-containing protein [Pleurostoma richardsiae]|uniref:SWIRM domain-containing protein n=1 Tax=Pleurostoma richardsiae TaxID=41990 RepID=A0AA38VH21_9PEZI|nr:SWIRM domain-containing protein [Pleurostoma richardsiae]
MAVESKKPLDISNLMSPPEPTPFDTFSHGQMATATRATATPGKASVPRPPLSPPISPFAKPASVIDPSHNTIHGVVKDPILYPSSDVSSSPPQPLFNEDGSSIETRRVVDEHVAARPTTLFDHSTPPEREHYELALYFQSEVMKKFMRNPRGWLRKEREQLLADRRANSGRCQVKRPLKAIVPAEGTQPVIRVAFGGIPKPEAALSAVTNSKSTIRVKVSRPIRVNPQPNKSPRRVSPTPEPRSRTVAPNREDKDFASLPDYCPPLASLPSKQNSLKVDWKGNALDLSNDPFRHLLHPDELALAAGLRLDCATYLTSKRRIFMRRLDCFRIGKEFRKTDAQQACKIDVNKASKLWTAYEKVGWLNKEWMRHFA